MTKDERTDAADKGKDKADDVREVNGEKKDDKDGKPATDGKKDEEQKEGTPTGLTTVFPFACFWTCDS